jgi:hypothetical protein
MPGDRTLFGIHLDNQAWQHLPRLGKIPRRWIEVERDHPVPFPFAMFGTGDAHQAMLSFVISLTEAEDNVGMPGNFEALSKVTLRDRRP